MIQSATYTDGQDILKVSVDRIDVLLRSEETLNFPRIIELDGDRLVLPYGRGRHGGQEARWSAISEDGGKTWADVPAGSPWGDNVQTSGILGYLKDGIIAYIDVFPLEMEPWQERYRELANAGKPWYRAEIKNPTWRLRYFSQQGDLLEDTTFNVRNLPWKTAAYYCYGDLLQMENGDLFTALGVQVPEDTGESIVITTFFVRSTDGGKTWDYVAKISPWKDVGEPFGPEGVNEPTMAVLANGDILCVMRTSGYTPLCQSRSKDGGNTWSNPVSSGWPAAKPQLRLLSNGVLACSSGRGIYGHPQVTHAMFSIDGTGESWQYPFAFHTGPGCSYTSNMERDGKFYVIYSDSSFTKEVGEYDMPYQSIKWAALDVTKEKRV